MNFIHMESHIGKVWADWKYIQNITLSFLAKAPHIKNKPAVFLALFFNNLFDEMHNRDVSSQTNVDSLYEFTHEDRDFDLVRYYKPAMFLMTNKEYIPNDLISENDFEWFKDLLTYHQPFEVRSGIFGIVQDDLNFSFKFRRTSLNIEQLKVLIPECIKSMIHSLPVIGNRDLRYAYADTLNRILKNSDNFRVKN